jgi:hypothetical protein
MMWYCWLARAVDTFWRVFDILYCGIMSENRQHGQVPEAMKNGGEEM